MPVELYRLMHVTGIILALTSLSALAMLVFNLPASAKFADIKGRKILSAFHGVGLLFVLVGGFGLMARLGITNWDGWLITKLVIWLVLGALVMFIKRSPKQAMTWYLASLILPIIAVYMVKYQPF